MAIALVTGGAGFIGSHLVRALLAHGARVRVLDDLSAGRRANLEGLDCELQVGSVTDAGAVARAVAGVDTVFHLAAVASPPRSLDEPEWTAEVNVGGTGRVLEAAAGAGVRRVVLASSCALYGHPVELPVTEDGPARPDSPYASSKLAAEQLALHGARAGRTEAVVLRYFNVYGPRQDPSGRYATAIPRFIRAFERGEAVTLHGDGRQTRDFCFVHDVVRATLAAATAAGASGQVFNVGTGTETSLLDLLEALQARFGRPVEVEYAPRREGDVRRSVACTARSRDGIGFEARTSLAEGLARTVGWVGGHHGA